jgi:nitronate monooxygenase
MAISTRLTERLHITHPVLSAPMAFAAGGRLAAAVSNAGGLGLIGGGYGDGAWLDAQFREAGNARIGCGFITWSLKRQPQLLEAVLAHRPAALFLSFDDPSPFARRIKETGAILICQVQTRGDAERALDCAADVVVAQGAEAGGHGEKRATMTLVPEIADLIAERAAETLLCAAGGIADGRGLAAALMLGADGVLVGSRFWASTEALVHPTLQAAAIAATGDDTVHTSVTDIVRHRDWPDRYKIRVLRNEFTDRWHGREDELRASADREAPAFDEAMASGDARIATPIVGEAAGLISSIEPAGVILERMVGDAEAIFRGARRWVGAS